MVKIVYFSMAGMCHGPVSAWMECVTVKNVSFIIDVMCHGVNGQFQHVWIMSSSKLSVSAWLECVKVKIVSFSMSGICHGQNRQFVA
jgi:hypothetical protein